MAKKRHFIRNCFNDESFKNLIDQASIAGYQSTMIALFLDSVEQSYERVTIRGIQQSGIIISGNNVEINFNESFKNIASYFFYFDKSEFIYTGTDGENQKIMSFQKAELITYQSNNLQYPQRFAELGFIKKRLNENAFQIIKANQNFSQSHTR
jgi:predicted ABC-type ATPase